MLDYITTTSTLAFDKYGDLYLPNNELHIETNKIKILFDKLKDYLKSDIGSYKLLPSYGNTFTNFVGKGITEKLKTDLANSIKSGIIDLNIMPQEWFDVFAVIVDTHTIALRIIVLDSDDLTIKLSYNSEQGLSVDY